MGLRGVKKVGAVSGLVACKRGRPLAHNAQVLACFGALEKAALLHHMSVGETLHLIQVRDSWAPKASLI